MATQPGMMGAFSGNMRSAQDQVMQGEMQQAANYASLGLEGRAALAGGQLGKAAGNIGAQAMGADPEQLQPKEVIRAKKMQKVQEQAQALGYHQIEDPEEFYSNMIPLLGAEGLNDEAELARTQLEQARLVRAEENVAKTNSYAAQLKAQADLIKANGEDRPDKGTLLTLAPPGTKSKKDGSSKSVTRDIWDENQYEEVQKMIQAGWVNMDDLPTGEQTPGEALAASADSIYQAEQLKAEANKVGQLRAERNEKIISLEGERLAASSKKLVTAGKINRILERGGSQFGTGAEARSEIVKATGMVSTTAGHWMGKFLQMDTVDEQEMTKAVNEFSISLVNDLGTSGGRQLKAVIDMVKDASPSIWNTNEMLGIFARGLEKDALLEADRARYLINAEDEYYATVTKDTPPLNLQKLKTDWDAAHRDDPRYNMSDADYKMAQRIAKYGGEYQARLRDATEFDPDNNFSGKTYWSMGPDGNKYYFIWDKDGIGSDGQKGTPRDVMDYLSNGRGGK